LPQKNTKDTEVYRGSFLKVKVMNFTAKQDVSDLSSKWYLPDVPNFGSSGSFSSAWYCVLLVRNRSNRNKLLWTQRAL